MIVAGSPTALSTGPSGGVYRDGSAGRSQFPRNLALFEVVINAIRKVAPGAAIAFNTRPDDSADAAARGLALGSRVV
ncbi:MAG: hypothetical protein DMF97_05785 [Acidobacteria bacterium]|nr:MAG: hypothetical protein DMF97_05785 [Acidobacteriota bacterium]